MNNELKEILKDLEYASGVFDYIITPDRCTLLLDYITNLQQNYNDNVTKYEELLEKYFNIQYRIEKALNILYHIGLVKGRQLTQNEMSKLYLILQGDSDE